MIKRSLVIPSTKDMNIETATIKTQYGHTIVYAKYSLENTEGAIKYGQSRETDMTKKKTQKKIKKTHNMY